MFVSNFINQINDSISHTYLILTYFQIVLTLVSEDGTKDFAALVSTIINTYKKLFNVENEDLPDDSDVKKLPHLVLSTMNLLADQIPLEAYTLSQKVNKTT